MNETIGSLLKETREALGFTLDQVAMETKIQKRYLIDLETENFDDMPGIVYEKGFLKTYASLLGLDTVDVMNLYEKCRFSNEEDISENENLVLDNEKKENYKKIKTIALIFILLLFISYGLYNFFVGKFNSETIIENKIIETLDNLEVDNVDKNLVVDSLETEEAFIEDHKDESIQEHINNETKDLLKEENNLALKEINNGQNLDDLIEKNINTNKKEIQLIVKGKSWVEVYKNKQRVFYNIANSGTITVSGNESDSIFVKVGDASQIELIYNGESHGLMGLSNQVVRKTF